MDHGPSRGPSKFMDSMRFVCHVDFTHFDVYIAQLVMELVVKASTDRLLVYYYYYYLHCLIMCGHAMVGKGHSKQIL